jgi:hypothetical protein
MNNNTSVYLWNNTTLNIPVPDIDKTMNTPFVWSVINPITTTTAAKICA